MEFEEATTKLRKQVSIGAFVISDDIASLLRKLLDEVTTSESIVNNLDDAVGDLENIEEKIKGYIDTFRILAKEDLRKTNPFR